MGQLLAARGLFAGQIGVLVGKVGRGRLAGAAVR